MSKLLIVDHDEGLSRRLTPRRGAGAATRVTSWADFAAHGYRVKLEESPIDIVVLNMEAPGAMPLTDAVRLHSRLHDLGFVYVFDTDRKLPSATLTALGQPGVTWVSSGATGSELKLRLNALARSLNRTRDLKRGDAPEHVAQQSTLAKIMPELHNRRSGRLDAAQIADWLGVPLKMMAQLLRRPYATVHKTPDAAGLQRDLQVYLRVGSALSHLAGSHERARAWLNAPNSDLEAQTPLAVIEAGEAEVVAELLEDALVGQPG